MGQRKEGVGGGVVCGAKGDNFKVIERERERSQTVALANVFPGCSHSNQTPGPLIPSLTEHPAEEKK